jgi:hypothetical protein
VINADVRRREAVPAGSADHRPVRLISADPAPLINGTSGAVNRARRLR